MFRLTKPGDFSRALSQSFRLKFILAWVTFGGLVIPTALLMSLGFPEYYALPLMLVAIPPFQYLVFCILKGLSRNDGTVVARTDTGKFPESLVNISVLAAYQTINSKYLNVLAERLDTDFLKLQAQMERVPVEGTIDRFIQDAFNSRIDVLGQIPADLESKLRETLTASWIQGDVNAGAKFTAPSLDIPITGFDIVEAGKISRDEMINLQRKPLEWRTGAKHLPSLLPPNLLHYE